MRFTDEDKAKCLTWKEANEEKYLAFAQANEDNPYLLDRILFSANNMGNGFIGKLFKMLFLSNQKDASSIMDSILSKMDVEESIDTVGANTEKQSIKSSLWNRIIRIFRCTPPQQKLSDLEIEQRREDTSLMLGAYLLSSNYYERRISLFFEVADINDGKNERKIAAVRPLLMNMSENIIRSSLDINLRTKEQWHEYANSLLYSQSSRNQGKMIIDTINSIKEKDGPMLKRERKPTEHLTENQFKSNLEDVEEGSISPSTILFGKASDVEHMCENIKQWLSINKRGDDIYIAYHVLSEENRLKVKPLKHFYAFLKSIGVPLAVGYPNVSSSQTKLKSSNPNHSGKIIEDPIYQEKIKDFKKALSL